MTAVPTAAITSFPSGFASSPPPGISFATATSITGDLNSLPTLSSLPRIVPPVLTTTFTPPSGCLDQYYQLDGAQTQEWLAPYAIDGVTAISCYASEWIQYSTSAEFLWMICPEGYQTQSRWTSPAWYAACCPSGFEGLSLNPSAANSRPASGATCWSSMQFTGILVTYYVNGTALSTSTQTPIGPSHHVFAHAYDGSSARMIPTTYEGGRVTSAPMDPTSMAEELTITGSVSVSVPAIVPNPSGNASETVNAAIAMKGMNKLGGAALVVLGGLAILAGM